MNSETTVQHGSLVRLHYSITLEDGTVADSSIDDVPLDIRVGDGSLHECLEAAVIGQKIGEEQYIQIAPEHGFGLNDEANVHYIDPKEFPDAIEPEEGIIVGFSMPNGDELPGLITKVTKQNIVVDFNHPLAGHTITFYTKILDINLDQKADS